MTAEAPDELMACAVPLLEQLRSVPLDCHEMIEVGPCHHRNIPYGRMCNEAADRIAALEAELAAARKVPREPTQMMKDAGYTFMASWSDDEAPITHLWQAMYDAALAKEPE